ncbi:UvrD-helicase domain-containing protein [soil metagenome]
MQLTPEQISIINSTGDIKINAVAGSGKTTTIIEYAKARPKNSRILYLAFNKSVKLEAIRKFSEQRLTNVSVETAHSLAYKHVVYNYNYRVKPQGYKTNEIVELLGLKRVGEKHAEYILANHVNKFIAYFCNSSKKKVYDLNYLDIITDKKAHIFVSSYYEFIISHSRAILNKMSAGQIEITHDFYLKKFQLSEPILGYDYILFDEGQDASPAMLDVFLKQKAVKVIVGDTHQQIYSWRYAVNSLERADFKTYDLSNSFRFSNDIADLAAEVIKWKSHLDQSNSINIVGKGFSKELKTKAVLARTNIKLLTKAIEYVNERKSMKQIYFEGNFNSYTFADDGASLYDVLNIYNNKNHLIKDKMISTMKDLDELEDYIEKTEDMQLGMMVEIVREYGNKIPQILKKIRSMCVDSDKKHKAEMIFSTVHRCKGMEYDSVQILDDFISEKRLLKLKNDAAKGTGKEEFSIEKLNEEINLLYVAITRAKKIVYIPKYLLPVCITDSEHIKVIDSKEERSDKKSRSYSVDIFKPKRIIPTGKAYLAGKFRSELKSANTPWTKALDNELTVMLNDGAAIPDIAKHFGRTPGAIFSRIKKLNLIDFYE